MCARVVRPDGYAERRQCATRHNYGERRRQMHVHMRQVDVITSLDHA